MDLLLVALGAFVFVEFVKALLDRIDTALHPWLKILATILVAGLLAAVVAETAEEGLPLALAGAGLAALAHKAHRLLSAAGDAQQVSVMAKATARRRL